MKRLIRIFTILTIASMSIWVIPQRASAQQASVSVQLFYDQLSPYGQWVNHPHYGYVWLPNVDAGFTPYGSNGHWVFTDAGWTWVSDYPWGWAPFHYGRWDFDNAVGWLWVPDTEWGPAWVSWRRSPGFYGWAPLRPGISIEVALGSGYHESDDRYIFVKDKDINRPDVNRYYVNKSSNVTIIKNSTVIVNKVDDNNRHITYVAGPDKNDVQKVTKKTVAPVAIQENDHPGQQLDKGQLKIYRPMVQKDNGNEQKAAPSKVVDFKDVKPRNTSGTNQVQKHKPHQDQNNPKQ